MASKQGPRLVPLSMQTWRVARRRDPLRFSYIAPEDAWGNAGNRFDVPGGGVLYTADTVEACYIETLARFRPTLRMLREINNDPGYMNAGGIPASWREDRVLARITGDQNGPPFVDIDNSSTLNYLNRDPDLRGRLAALGVMDLDRGALYTSARGVTRLLAQWVYAQTDDTGAGLYAGIRYQSRLGKQHVCWAIFDHRIEVTVQEMQAISCLDAVLQKVAAEWGLTIH